MKVKCKICGFKGFHNNSKVSEFWASQFLFIINYKKGEQNNCFICRKCVSKILDSLRFESCRIDDLYKPEVKEKKG